MGARQDRVWRIDTSNLSLITRVCGVKNVYPSLYKIAGEQDGAMADSFIL